MWVAGPDPAADRVRKSSNAPFWAQSTLCASLPATLVLFLHLNLVIDTDDKVPEFFYLGPQIDKAPV